jgi:hypothetical protein
MYPFSLIEAFTGDPTLGARATDPTVPGRPRRERHEELPKLRLAARRPLAATQPAWALSSPQSRRSASS